MNQSSFLRTSLRFHSALVILEPQIYLVLEPFGAENMSLLSERLVCKFNRICAHTRNSRQVLLKYKEKGIIGRFMDTRWKSNFDRIQ